MVSPLAISPSWTITYGSVTIGGSDANFLGPIEDTMGLFESYRRAQLSFDCIVYSTSASTFRTKQQELLTQFRTPRARLEVDAPSSLRDYNPSTLLNTGFDAEPTISQVEDIANCDRFQRYRITVAVSLPADLSGQSGRRDNMEMVSFEANRRRTITLRGQYTALGSNSAREQYDASIATYAAAAISEIESDSSVKWQLTDESADVNDTDKVLSFTREYREITVNQASGAADSSAVVIQDFQMSEMTPGSRDTYIAGAEVKPFQEFMVSYTAVIDLTDTDDSGLRSLWLGTLRPYLLTLAASRLNRGPTSGTTAIDQETYAPGLEPNTVTGSFRYVSRNGSGFISGSIEKTVIERTGLAFTPISTGRSHEFAIDEGPPMREFVVSISEERIKGGQFFDYGPPKDFWETERSTTFVEMTRGQVPNIITTVRRMLTIRYMYAIEYVGGQGGSSSGRRSNPQAFEPSNLAGQDTELTARRKNVSNKL